MQEERRVKVTLSLPKGLNEYFTRVAKELGFQKSIIVEELLKQNLYPMEEASKFDELDYNNVLMSLNYRKEMLENMKKESKE